MGTIRWSAGIFVAAAGLLASLPAAAQSFRVQCPTSTITHPSSVTNVNAEPVYNGPTAFTQVPVSGTQGGYIVPSGNVNGAIKCQQVSGGDGLLDDGERHADVHVLVWAAVGTRGHRQRAVRARSSRVRSTRRTVAFSCRAIRRRRTVHRRKHLADLADTDVDFAIQLERRGRHRP